jgi:hypothetical protein
VQAKDFRWASFVILAYESQVASSLSIALQKLGLRDALPQATLDYLDELATIVRRRNTRVVDQVIEVGRILNRVDVTPVLLKGGANLLRGLYPDRTMTDLDVLVPADMLDSCAASLRIAFANPPSLTGLSDEGSAMYRAMPKLQATSTFTRLQSTATTASSSSTLSTPALPPSTPCTASSRY